MRSARSRTTYGRKSWAKSAYGWAIHSGKAVERDGDYFGPTVNRVVAAERRSDSGGQILASSATAALCVPRCAGPSN